MIGQLSSKDYVYTSPLVVKKQEGSKDGGLGSADYTYSSSLEVPSMEYKMNKFSWMGDELEEMEECFKKDEYGTIGKIRNDLAEEIYDKYHDNGVDDFEMEDALALVDEQFAIVNDGVSFEDEVEKRSGSFFRGWTEELAWEAIEKADSDFDLDPVERDVQWCNEHDVNMPEMGGIPGVVQKVATTVVEKTDDLKNDGNSAQQNSDNDDNEWEYNPESTYLLGGTYVPDDTKCSYLR